MSQQTVTLYNKTSTGADQFWEAKIEDNKVTYTWGLLNGKKQTKVDVYQEGKNQGKANERTSAQQCELEVLAIAKKKIAKGYAPSLEQQGTQIPLPMLAKVYKDYKYQLTDKIHISPKLDGSRCILDLYTGKLWSRTGKEILGVPHIADEALKLHKIANIQFLDGELWKANLSFEEIASLTRPTKNIKKTSNIIEFHVFDVIAKMPYRNRLKLVESIEAKFILPIKSYCVNKNEVDEYHAKFVEAGYEGTMVRMDTESGYFVGKRTHELLKKKDFMDDEFLVIGFKHEENNDKLLGACFLMTKDNVIFKATPAVPLKQKAYIWTHQSEFKGKLATVKFQNIGAPLETSLSKEVKDFIKENPEFKHATNGPSPRFPILERFRSVDDMPTPTNLGYCPNEDDGTSNFCPNEEDKQEDTDMAKKKSVSLECVEGGSSKYYKMVDNGNSTFTCEYGKIGALKPQSATYDINLWEKKLNEKIKKGYAEV